MTFATECAKGCSFLSARGWQNRCRAAQREVGAIGDSLKGSAGRACELDRDLDLKARGNRVRWTKTGITTLLRVASLVEIARAYGPAQARCDPRDSQDSEG